MTDLLWLSDDQLDRIKPYFPLSWRAARGRSSCCERDRICDQERASLAGRAKGVWSP